MCSASPSFSFWRSSHDRRQHIRAYRFEIEDFDQDALQRSLLNAVGTLRALMHSIPNGFSIYVHCMSGVSRSAAVCALEHCDRTGLSYFDAMTKMRELRPCVAPNDGVASSLVGQKIPSISLEDIHEIDTASCGSLSQTKDSPNFLRYLRRFLTFALILLLFTK